MNTNEFKITGRTVDSQTNAGIPGIHIEAWDKDLIFDDLVGSAATDAEGRFDLDFDERHFKELIQRRPDLYFKLFQNGVQIPPEQFALHVTLPDGMRLSSHGDQVFWRLMPGETIVGIELGAVSEDALYVVKGRVTEPDGTPIVGLTVRLFDSHLGNLTPLGETETGEDGRFQISYPAKVFLDLGKQRPDLDVHVFDEQGEKIAWLPNPPLFNAGPTETINLVRGAQPYLGPAEFDLVVDALVPALQGANLATLDADAVNWLIGKTGEDPQQVLELAKASRMAVLTQQPPELFYALFRVGVPRTLPELIGQSPEAIRFALGQAAERNLIPADNLDDQAESLLASFKTKAVELAMQPPEDPQRLSLGTLLTTGVETAVAEQFLTAYAEHSGSIEAFWEGLQENDELASYVSTLQLTLQLGALSVDHRPMLDKLWQMHSAGEFATLADLVSQSESDWQSLITTEDIGVPPRIPGADDAQKVQNYACVIADMVEQSFPTAFVTARLHDDDPLKSFLADHPDFDLKATRIATYLQEQGEQLSDSDLTRLRAMQRVYRIAPRWRAAEKMLDDGLDSAYRVRRLGKNVFINKYRGLLGARQVRCTYERAHQVHAMGLRLLAEAGRFTAGTSMQVLDDQAVSDLGQGTVPEWQALFQDSLELCDCEHCRSVLGPAAYLVDTLHFLSDRMADEERSAKDVLFERRADLGAVELSCENSLNPIPYVDLINEILEDAVAAPQPFVAFTLGAADDFEADLNAHNLSDTLLGVFSDNGCPLERGKIRVGGEAQGRKPLNPWWAIDDIRFTYNIQTQVNESGNGTLEVVSRSRQTLGSAAERRAMPQYFNPDAYQRLRVQQDEPCKPQVYPWSLPFDRDWETIRIHLAHLQSSRGRILETFLPGDRRAILDHAELVHETLGLTLGEAMIIADAPMTDCAFWWKPGNEPEKLWGFAATSLSAEDPIPDPADNTQWLDSGYWLAVIAGRVDVLQQQSGLNYRKLLDLLGTYYVNPLENGERPVHIVSTDTDHPDTCDTSRLEVCGLDEVTAVRIVRFVRLWRRLSWSMRDLDRAITALAPGGVEPSDIDTEFLRNLAGLVRLQQQLGLSVERLLPFWGPIDSAIYVAHDEARQPRLPSLYELLFRNRALLELPEPDFPENPNDLAHQDPQDPGWTWHHCAATIGLALGIGAKDLQLLLSRRQCRSATEPDADARQPFVAVPARHTGQGAEAFDPGLSVRVVAPRHRSLQLAHRHPALRRRRRADPRLSLRRCRARVSAAPHGALRAGAGAR